MTALATASEVSKAERFWFSYVQLEFVRKLHDSFRLSNPSLHTVLDPNHSRMCSSRYGLLRSDDAECLLETIAAAGAIASHDRGKHVPSDEPGLVELVKAGLVTEMVVIDNPGLETHDHDHFTLSSKGRQYVYQCVMLKSPKKILAYKRRGLPAISAECDDHTTVELILVLKESGWSDLQKPKYIRSEPYKKGEPKVWYWSENSRVSKQYLKTLALSAQILAPETGIREIHHHQPQAYYKSLQMKRPVLPNQPLQYYKLKAKKSGHEGADQDHAGTHETHASSDIDDDTGS